jgi:hypothetical protein
VGSKGETFHDLRQEFFSAMLEPGRARIELDGRVLPD